MSARLMWVVQSAAGVGQAGQDVDLHRYASDAKIADFTDAGNGLYYVDHTISERVYIKVNAVKVTASDGMMFPADDVALSANLASTATGKGAALIGVEDASARFTGTTVEAVLAEIKTAVELASTAATKGASLIGVQDAGGYFTGAQVEAVLAEIGAIFSLLSGLTAVAAELNKLDGASANVTAANLNLLTASGETTLHYHDGRYYTETEIGTSGIPQLMVGAAAGTDGAIKTPDATAGYNADLILQPGKNSGGGHRSDILAQLNAQDTNADGGNLDVNCLGSGTGTDGNLRVKKSDGIFHPVITDLELAEQFSEVVAGEGFNYFFIDAGGTTGDPATDPATTVKWQEDTGSYVIHYRRKFWQMPGMRRVGIYVEAKVAAGSLKGYVKAEVSTVSDEVIIVETAYDDHTLWIDLSELPVGYGKVLRELKISVMGDGTYLTYVNENFIAWGEK